MRFANPAWETLTGRPLAAARGMRISSRQSAGDLALALAVPPEVWAGQSATVRRPIPGANAGPPWWDISFFPLMGNERPLAVVGTIAVVGTAAKSQPTPTPAAMAALRHRNAARFAFDRLDGKASASERLAAQTRLAAATLVPIWIHGEPGTGKETVARIVHHNSSVREAAFVGIDCRAVQPYLVEGILFGRGGLAGTKHAGTLFLKNPAAFPRDFQHRIATWVTGDGGPRLICASDCPAAVDVAAGKLVPAFQTTLGVLEIRVPPLRERADDLLRFASRASDDTALSPTPEATTALRAYDWPGNLRELRSVLAEAVAKAGANPIGLEHLPRAVREAKLISDVPTPPTAKPRTLDAVLEAAERRLIELALAKSNHSPTAAADALGIPRPRLLRRIEALGIRTPGGK